VGQVGGAGQGACRGVFEAGSWGDFQTLVEISLMQGKTREHNYQPSFVVLPNLQGSLGKGVTIWFSDTCDMSGSGKGEAQAVVMIL
jgi:hypothetical protein